MDSEKGQKALEGMTDIIFSGGELSEVPKPFKKFSTDEFSNYFGLMFAYGFGCSGMFSE